MRIGFVLGSLTLFTVLAVGRSSVDGWYTNELDIEEVLSGVIDSLTYIFL